MSYLKVLAAFDGSKASERALQQAINLTENDPETRLTIVHVAQCPDFDPRSFVLVPPDGYMETKVILQYAQANQNDLIVMGSRGLSAIQEWMHGSVSHQVVHQAPIPVLIVK